MGTLTRHKRILSLLVALCAVLSLAACGIVTSPPADDGETPPLQDDAPTTPDNSAEPPAEPEVPEDKSFTLLWNPDRSLNPYIGKDSANCDLISLIYEGLFRLGDGFVAEPVLAENYKTTDGLIYLFTIRSGVYFHSGKMLTAEDAAYSLNMAAGTDKYGTRLDNLLAVNAKDSHTLEIVLNTPDYSLPTLLDVPIVEQGTGEQPNPPGTGRYRLLDPEGEASLVLYNRHREKEGAPPETIELLDSRDIDVARAFSTGKLSALNWDLSGMHTLNLHLNYESRYYDTTNLIYIGFNLEIGHLTEMPEIRRAISLAIDTEKLCTDVYDRNVRHSPLILSPALSCYDAAWEPAESYSRQKSSAALASLGLADTDNDGLLEYNPLGGDFTLTVLVYSGNKTRLEAAEAIVANLRSVGLSAVLSALSWDEYTEALEKREFDLCVNEVRLPANFDISAMVTPRGSLNFGCITDDNYAVLISDFLSAEDETARSDAARALCEYTEEHCAVIPIAYKKYTLLTHVGAVKDLYPSQSGAFANAAWSLAR